MSHKHKKSLTNWQKASALVPLALLSGAWTTSLAMTGGAANADPRHPTLPDGTSLPAGAVKSPASISLPGEIAPGVTAGSAGDVIASASTNGIPSAALAAYQRAAQVIDAADTGCHIDWSLIAAIGRVESDHGRYGGNTLGSDGVSHPGIYGIPLDGTHGTQLVKDTDGGQYDNDPIYDRAVGPMQFIPATWAVVGVDGDGNGVRNPQDIDDAALATAVYLCSGSENLATTPGARSAVLRYNHSQAYVDLVLSIAKAYATGDYSSVPDGTAAATTFEPWSTGSSGYPGTRTGAQHGTRHHTAGSTSGSGTKGSGSGSAGSGTGGGSTPAVPGAPSSPAPSSGDPVGSATGTATQAAGGAQKVVITTAQAVSLCTDELKKQYGSAPDKAVSACAAKLQGMTLTEAKNAVSGIVAGLADLVGSLVGGLTGGSTGGGLLP